MQNMFFFEKDGFDYDKFIGFANHIYEAFYDQWNEEEEVFSALVEKGDLLLKNKELKPFFSEIAKRRYDFISSDREVAAFAAAFIVFANA